MLIIWRKKLSFILIYKGKFIIEKLHRQFIAIKEKKRRWTL